MSQNEGQSERRLYVEAEILLVIVRCQDDQRFKRLICDRLLGLVLRVISKSTRPEQKHLGRGVNLTMRSWPLSWSEALLMYRGTSQVRGVQMDVAQDPELQYNEALQVRRIVD